MKKTVLFLINGLGIEKQGSYSISIDQCMPNLSKTKETSFFTTAIINSLEYKSAYERFFLGDTSRSEIKYMNDYIINDNIINNSTFQELKNKLTNDKSKLHIFLEPDNDQIGDLVSNLVKRLELSPNKKIYLHLLLTQQSTTEYKKIIEMVNFIKYHLDERITVGFIMGKEVLPTNLTEEILTNYKKILFYCSCERWTETDKKLLSLAEEGIRPCEAPTFCAVNTCNFEKDDVILFFNMKSTNYDNYIETINYGNKSILKDDTATISTYSIIRLDTKYGIKYIAENIDYPNSFDKLLEKANLKTLIITNNENMSYINFLANGLKYVNNPRIQFMNIYDPYFSNANNIINIIDNTDYNIIIFDYHMDVSKTINDLKSQLERIDVVLGIVANTCVNKHSLFITSLYGIKKSLPIADYNSEIVTIDYEMQIPIFFFDYSYPRSKFALYPGETNDILNTILRTQWNTNEIDTLIRPKGLFTSLLFK